MSELSLWKNQEIDKLRRDMERLFKRFYTSFGVPASLLGSTEALRIKLSDTKDTLTLEVELTGIKHEDIELSVSEDALVIKVNIISENISEDDVFRTVEKSSRSFSRTITLPCRINTEAVKASYRENVLTVLMPKLQPAQARGVKIEINPKS